MDVTGGESPRLGAAILDMDGVVTRTAPLHFEAWKRVFDEVLRERAGEEARPFDVDDYRAYVDGKPRYDGVASFLASRGFSLPEGGPDDPPEAGTVRGVGNRKNRVFRGLLEEKGAEVHDDATGWIGSLRRHGVPVALISSSRNAPAVLAAAGVEDLFDARVDGNVGDDLGLPGKPDPAYFEEAARRLGTPPGRAVVVEDAVAGVVAGRRGGFGLVVGVDRDGRGDALRAHGADLVVEDLRRLMTDEGEPPTFDALRAAAAR